MIASPNLMVASAAQRTSRIRLGPAVNVLPFHHPIRLAEEGAMLDMMSEGRLLWGIGRGIQPEEFVPWKVDHNQSREIFDETHEAVIRAWTQPAFFPFSGWKASFFGDLHGRGRDAIDFYTEKKVIVERWG